METMMAAEKQWRQQNDGTGRMEMMMAIVELLTQFE